jgi:hypothetical protein
MKGIEEKKRLEDCYGSVSLLNKMEIIVHKKYDLIGQK